MTEVVTVVCTARLHLGFFDLNGELGRRFGSIGMSLTAPATRMVLRRAAQTSVTGPERARALQHLAALTAQPGLFGPDGDGHGIAIEAAMPAHAGLGSGTQLALAVATGLRRLHGLPDDLRADAALLGRGGRSGVGIGLFAAGGVVVDGGRGHAAAPPPQLARLAVPQDWRVLLLLDRDHAGLSGERERQAFADLPDMPAADAAALCRPVLMQALPALAESDLPAFGDAVTRLQKRLGDYFAPAQGGRFASPRVAAALARLQALGAAGVGQSSWGPTGFAFAADADAARWLCARLAMEHTGALPELLVCQARNSGAEVHVA